MLIPQAYVYADISLMGNFNLPAPQQLIIFNWARPISRDYANWVRHIKKDLRSNPHWPYNMIYLTSRNPVWGKGQVFNPRSWEGIGKFHLDRFHSRPETRRSHQDMRLGRHDHQEDPVKRPTLLARLFGGASSIELIEDVENGGSKSLRQIQNENWINTEERPYPWFKTSADNILTRRQLQKYKDLFNKQVSPENSQYGNNFYKPVTNAAKFVKDKYITKVNKANSTGKNYFSDVDDVRTGWDGRNAATWKTSDELSKYQRVPFTIHDIRNGTTVILPTSIRSITTNLTPSWIEDEFIGRIDDVPTYVKTVKEYSIDMVFSAQEPIDYIVMWRKLGILESFQYPQYDQNAIQINPPIVRIRLGDMIRRGRGAQNGVAGFFRNFSIITDEAMTIWQLDNEELSFKHGKEILGQGPRYVEVSFNFKVLHDSSYEEQEDGTIDFTHDAVYKDGFYSTKLNSSYKQGVGSFNRGQDVGQENRNRGDGGFEGGGDGNGESKNSVGDFNKADHGGEVS